MNIRIYSIFTLFFIFFSTNGQNIKSINDPYNWVCTDLLDLKISTEGKLIGLVDDFLLIEESRNASENQVSFFYLELNKNDKWKQTTIKNLPFITLATTINYKGRLFCVGGLTKGKPAKTVFSINLSTEDSLFSITHYPDLPQGVLNPGVTIYSDNLYVIGGQTDLENETYSNLIYSINLNDNQEKKWSELPEYPGLPRKNPFFIAQSDGNKTQLYLFGENSNMKQTALADYSYCPQSREWNQISKSPKDLAQVAGFSIGQSHIQIFPQNTDSLFYLYHTITDTWVKGNTPIVGDKIVTIRSSNNKISLLEIIDDKLILWEGIPKYISKRLAVVDYFTLIGYFLILIIIGFFFSKKEKTTSDYFRGGKRVPWIAAGISIIATKISAISFIAFPTKSFATDLLYVLIPGYYLIAIWVIPKYFVPFLTRLDVTSVYEYLGKRFNTLVRTVGSVTFSLYEVVRMGVLFLVPAIVMSVASDMDIYMSIIIMGIIATIYTYLGGLEAVIWSDVLQTLIMVGGAIATIGFIFYHVDGSIIEILKNVGDQGKLRVVDTSFNLVDATIFVFILSWIGGLKDYLSNQTTAQRFIATKNEKEAKKSILMSGIGGIFVVWLFLFLGTALYIYYQNFPENLVPNMERPDALFPWFIIKELPVGVSGLLIAATFSAAMSSLDSAMNSASSLFITDIYKRFISKDERRAFKYSKILIIIFGIFGTGVALILASFQIQSIIDQFFAFLGLFGGGLGGLFMLGLFTTRATSRGAIIGFIVSSISQYFIQGYMNLNVFVYVFTGMAICFLTGYLSSILIPGERKTLEGLTVFTLKN